MHNAFWKNVLSDWFYINENITIKTNKHILTTNLLYNPKISKSNLFFPTGIKMESYPSAMF